MKRMFFLLMVSQMLAGMEAVCPGTMPKRDACQFSAALLVAYINKEPGNSEKVRNASSYLAIKKVTKAAQNTPLIEFEILFTVCKPEDIDDLPKVCAQLYRELERTWHVENREATDFLLEGPLSPFVDYVYIPSRTGYGGALLFTSKIYSRAFCRTILKKIERNDVIY